MHRHRGLFLIGLYILIITSFSCAKHLNDPVPSNRLVSYSLSASGYKPFSNIIYTNGDGSVDSASAADSTSAWTQTIATSINPFTAQMEVQGFNNTSDDINFTISIYVDGVITATKEDSVLKFTSFDSQIDAVVH